MTVFGAVAAEAWGESLRDAGQREARGDQLAHAELGHHGQGARKAVPRPEGAADPDLAVVHVPKIQGQRAPLRFTPTSWEVAGGPGQRERFRTSSGLPRLRRPRPLRDPW